MSEEQPANAEGGEAAANATDLEALAKDDGPSAAIGITALIGTLWWIATLVAPYPIDPFAYNAPVIYLWGSNFTGSNAMFASWLPTAWFAAWVAGLVFSFIEMIAWFVSGDFFATWAWMGLIGGTLGWATPVVFALLYIIGVGAGWTFGIYTPEVYILGGSGIFWLLNLIMHLVFIGPLMAHLDAKKKLAEQENCVCDACPLPENDLDRTKAALECTKACEIKCPPKA